jgi:large subunit ribosomal protein L14e
MKQLIIGFILKLLSELKALVDGPCSNVKRQSMNFKLLHLTKFTISIPHGAREGTVRKQWEKAEITKKWNESSWAKKRVSKALVRNLYVTI